MEVELKLEIKRLYFFFNLWQKSKKDLTTGLLIQTTLKKDYEKRQKSISYIWW